MYEKKSSQDFLLTPQDPYAAVPITDFLINLGFVRWQKYLLQLVVLRWQRIHSPTSFRAYAKGKCRSGKFSLCLW